MFTLNISFGKESYHPLRLESIETGQTLLEVCLQNDVEIGHDCGGSCACSTCHIYVMEGEEWMEERGRREAAFISRAENPGPCSRLACQCLLTGAGGDISIIIPGETKLNSASKGVGTEE